MPESTLAADFDSLYGEASWMLGWGRATPPLSVAGQHNSVLSVIQAGLRQFYFPPVLPGQRSAHEWFFLHPLGSISLVAGTRIYNLPDDFGSLEDVRLTWDSGSASNGNRTIMVIDDEHLRRRRGGPAVGPGVPTCAAVSAVAPDGAAGTRYQLEFDREPNTAGRVTYRYHAIPNMVSPTNPHPHGGAEHTETILASIKSAAEFHIDSMHGVHHQKFLERLSASISRDNRLRPRQLGYNGDGGSPYFTSTPDSMPLYYRGQLVGG